MVLPRVWSVSSTVQPGNMVANPRSLSCQSPSPAHRNDRLLKYHGSRLGLWTAGVAWLYRRHRRRASPGNQTRLELPSDGGNASSGSNDNPLVTARQTMPFMRSAQCSGLTPDRPFRMEVAVPHSNLSFHKISLPSVAVVWLALPVVSPSCFYSFILSFTCPVLRHNFPASAILCCSLS